MTSFAFILGVVPLVLATGAGANARKSIGITVFSGMLRLDLPCRAVRSDVFCRCPRWENWRASRKATKPANSAVGVGGSNS